MFAVNRVEMATNEGGAEMTSSIQVPPTKVPEDSTDLNLDEPDLATPSPTNHSGMTPMVREKSSTVRTKKTFEKSTISFLYLKTVWENDRPVHWVDKVLALVTLAAVE